MNDAELIYISQGACREYMKNSNKDVLVKFKSLIYKSVDRIGGDQ